MALQDLTNAFGLLVMVWNCRSLYPNIIEFKKFINQSNPQIICLSETWLKLTDTLKLQPYNIYRKDRFGKGGGVAILVSKKLISRPHNNFQVYNEASLETLVVQILIDNIWTDFCTIYNPCTNINKIEFTHLFDNLSQNSIICGDFNAHHPIWSSTTNSSSRLNPTGSALAEAMLSNTHFCLLTPPETPTHFNKQHNIKSTIDLALGSGLYSACDNIHIGELLGADHYPIIYCFKYIQSNSSKKTPLKWDLEKLNWVDWKEKLISNFNSNILDPDFKNITDVITDTTKQFIKLDNKQIKYKQQKPFWCAECSYHIALRRKAQKKYEKFPTLDNKTALNKQTAITKRFLLKKKREKWHEYCSSLSQEEPTSRVWKFFKSMNGKPNFDFSYPILKNGDTDCTERHIANLFAEHYYTIFNNNTFIQNSERKETDVQSAIQIDHNVAYNQDFIKFELVSAIESLNENSAMGPDTLHNTFFTHLPEILLENLLLAINKIWRSGNIPQFFKQPSFLSILKPGKDPSQLESYRPISLISCFAKLIEKLVFQRLYSYVENRNHLPNFQCGFR